MFQKCINILKLLSRIFRCCKKERFLPLTNCAYTHLEKKPRSIVTWNIQGLFLHMNNQKTKNIISTLQSFQSTDIICLQEVFDDDLKETIIYKLKDVYPYYLLGNTNKRYLFGEDSGLLILSRYPIEFKKEIILNQYNFPDRLANKSILYFSIGDLNLVTTHLQSNNMFENESMVIRQLYQLKEKSPFDKYIITGDLNSEMAYFHLQLEKNNYTRTWGDDEILDYILPCNYTDIWINTSVYDMNINNVSDHYPLSGVVQRNKDSSKK